jgi:hypothetical protein
MVSFQELQLFLQFSWIELFWRKEMLVPHENKVRWDGIFSYTNSVLIEKQSARHSCFYHLFYFSRWKGQVPMIPQLKTLTGIISLTS